MSTLLVSIVNWNTRDSLRTCLVSLRAALEGMDATIVVVDNASTDGSAYMVEAEFPEVRLVRSARNVGFAGGHNLAIHDSAAANVLILNPDVEISASAVRSLVAFLGQTPHAAAVSPALTGHDGRLQHYMYRRLPTAAQIMLFWTALRPLAALVPFLRSRILEHAIGGSDPIQVDQLPGAAMLVRGSALSQVGLFDPGYFIWWEDVDWAWRARLLGVRLFVLPNAAVRHAGGASFTPWRIEKRVFQFYRAFYRFLARHSLHRLARRVTPVIMTDLTLRQWVLRPFTGATGAEMIRRTRKEIREILAGMERGLVPDFASAEPGFTMVPVATMPHAHAHGGLPTKSPQGTADAGAGLMAAADATVVAPTVAGEPTDPAGPVDVIIVNWNGRRYLGRCIDALQASTVPVRIVVVDNASTDGSAEHVMTSHPDVEIIEAGRNAGYAGGANIGLVRTSGRYAFVMNPDVIIESDHLAILQQRLETDPAIGAAQGKLYHASDSEFIAGRLERRLIDSAGHEIRRSRMVVDRGQGEPDGPRYDTEASIFSACGAALFLRRSMLEDIATDGEYFAEQFFAYKEDVDLGWRARLMGWQVRYVPGAVAHHVRALPFDRASWRHMSLAARRHSWKNHYLLMLRNDRITDVLRSLPFIAAWEVARLGHALLRDPRVLPAYAETMRSFRPALRARRALAARRRAMPDDIRAWFGARPVPVTVSPPHREVRSPQVSA